ncbi:TerB family tellurite resistance protein [Aquincola tertiaricarbonis]|uniref:TerB family tellurite resistance protein n=1 Tax=Aquincola tertiaricarbonis TaxID=391953 RepID=A0ABY4S512_AQUTE|nr:TerB family tellurite resistance protein [Aquincola tertiaricarbonis]URI08521.1 TerB family tellurite resistance protein [Aquincola tertiaricarbonis]
MRHYPANSPEAAARIVALVLISDGHVCRSELALLEEMDLPGELGLRADAMPAIVQTLCEDLLTAAPHGAGLGSSVDADLLGALMRDITDLSLQRKVVQLALAAAAADAHLSDGEEAMLEAVRRHWPQAMPLAIA